MTSFPFPRVGFVGRVLDVPVVSQSMSNRALFTAPYHTTTNTLRISRRFQIVSFHTRSSKMASKAALKRPADFVDFLNASPTRTSSLAQRGTTIRR